MGNQNHNGTLKDFNIFNSWLLTINSFSEINPKVAKSDYILNVYQKHNGNDLNYTIQQFNLNTFSSSISFYVEHVTCADTLCLDVAQKGVVSNSLIARATIPNLQNVPCDNPISFDTVFVLAPQGARNNNNASNGNTPELACKANITMLKPGPIASQQELLKYAATPGPKQAVILCKLGFKGKVNINLYHYAVIEKTLQFLNFAHPVIDVYDIKTSLVADVMTSCLISFRFTRDFEAKAQEAHKNVPLVASNDLIHIEISPYFNPAMQNSFIIPVQQERIFVGLTQIEFADLSYKGKKLLLCIQIEDHMANIISKLGVNFNCEAPVVPFCFMSSQYALQASVLQKVLRFTIHTTDGSSSQQLSPSAVASPTASIAKTIANTAILIPKHTDEPVMMKLDLLSPETQKPIGKITFTFKFPRTASNQNFAETILNESINGTPGTWRVKLFQYSTNNPSNPFSTMMTISSSRQDVIKFVDQAKDLVNIITIDDAPYSLVSAQQSCNENRHDAFCKYDGLLSTCKVWYRLKSVPIPLVQPYQPVASLEKAQSIYEKLPQQAQQQVQQQVQQQQQQEA